MRILIAESEGFSQKALTLLRSRHHVIAGNYDRPDLLKTLEDVEVLWVRLRFLIDRELLESAPRLKFLISNATGLTHIDLAELRRRGIRLLSLKGEAQFLKDVRATAEHTMALLLALVRHIPAAAQHAVQGRWERGLFKGEELFGKTMGIVGYGRLGRIVARYARGFGMRVCASDPSVTAESADADIELLPLWSLLERSDVVSLHASLDASNRCFFGREEFFRMKPHAWFINTARGELIDEAALLAVLESGRLAGAALDVLTSEQSEALPANPLIAYSKTHPNLLITPHIGGCTIESFEKTEMYLAGKFMHTVEEEIPGNR